MGIRMIQDSQDPGNSYLVHKIVEKEQGSGEVRREETLDRALFPKWPTSQIELAAKYEEYNY